MGTEIDLTPIHAWGTALIDGEWMAGLSIAILDGPHRHQFLFGEAQADAVHEIGSVTKLVTTETLLRMAAEGRLSLDDRVESLLPEGTPFPGDITLRHLATHTSGLPRLPDNLAPADPQDPYADYTERELLQYLGGFQAAAKPGTGEVYSNLGVGLLGYLLTRASGAASYGDLVARYVTGPLAMRHTSTTLQAVAGHDASGVVQPAWTFDVLAGAGALRSTLADVERFVRNSMTRTEMVGWSISEDGLAWHNGMTAGATCYVAFEPGAARGVVLLASTATPMLDGLGVAIMRVLRGQNPDFQLPPHSVVPLATLQRYVGTYALTPEFALEVSLQGEKLFARGTGQDALRSFPVTERVFRFRGPLDVELEFEPPTGGGDVSEGLWLRQDGSSVRGVRASGFSLSSTSPSSTMADRRQRKP